MKIDKFRLRHLEKSSAEETHSYLDGSGILTSGSHILGNAYVATHYAVELTQKAHIYRLRPMARCPYKIIQAKVQRILDASIIVPASST